MGEGEGGPRGAVGADAASLQDEAWQVEGDIATVGITDYAAKALGDVVYVDLPEVGASFDKG